MLTFFTLFPTVEVNLSEFERLTLFYSIIKKQFGTLTDSDSEMMRNLAIQMGVPESSIDSCLIDSSSINPHILKMEAEWLLTTCINLYCPLNACPTSRTPSGYKICIQFANSIGLSVMDVDRIMRARFARVKRTTLKLSYA